MTGVFFSIIQASTAGGTLLSSESWQALSFAALISKKHFCKFFYFPNKYLYLLCITKCFVYLQNVSSFLNNNHENK